MNRFFAEASIALKMRSVWAWNGSRALLHPLVAALGLLDMSCRGSDNLDL